MAISSVNTIYCPVEACAPGERRTILRKFQFAYTAVHAKMAIGCDRDSAGFDSRSFRTLDDLAYTSDPTICVYLLADVKAFTSTPHAAFLQAPSCIATPSSHPPRQPLLMHFQHVYQVSHNKCSGFTYPVNRGLRAGYFLSHTPFTLARLTRALIFQTSQLFVHVDDNTIVAASQA